MLTLMGPLLIALVSSPSGAQGGAALSIPPAALKSPFGIEYVLVGHNVHDEKTAQRYKDIGATWVKFQDCPWQYFEPSAPVDGTHTYTWDKFDNHIRWWQANGYQIQIHVKTRNEWAGQPPKGFFSDNPVFLMRFRPFISTPPKEEHWDDWGAFVEALVERYDGDGADDMPGLKYPILYYEVESEAQHPYWMGTLEEYGKTLGIFYSKAKQACQGVNVILSGIELGKMAKDNPDDAEMARRVEAEAAKQPAVADYIRSIAAFVKGSLAMGGHYDIVEFHALTDYTAIPGTVKFIRRQLEQSGFPSKELWAGDATSAPELGTMAAMAGQESREGEKGRLNFILKDPKNPDFPQVNAWFRREQASLTVKKIVMAIDSSLTRVFMCCLEDWVGSPWPYHGMVDPDGTPRPAYRAIQFLTNKLEGFTDEKRLETEDGVSAFRFRFPKRDVYIAWYETNQDELDLPTAENPTHAMALRLRETGATVLEAGKGEGSPAVHVFSLDVVCEDPRSEGQTQPVENSTVTLQLNRYPVFVDIDCSRTSKASNTE
jgi:hypothetical protein